MEYKYIIGIDTGTKTGIAVWSTVNKNFLLIETTFIHRAMNIVKHYSNRAETFVLIEDARKRKFYGNVGNEILQGVGSVKRDAAIWEDYLKDIGADFKCVHPVKGATKWADNTFRQITKWEKKTDQHGRDAAMMVFQINKTQNN